MINEYKKMNIENKKKQGDSNPNLRLLRIVKCVYYAHFIYFNIQSSPPVARKVPNSLNLHTFYYSL